MKKVDVYYEGELSTKCVHREAGVEIRTDVGTENQGLGRYFSPTDLIAASLGSCVLSMMGFAANKLKVDLKGAHCVVTKEVNGTQITSLSLTVRTPKDYPADIKEKLMKAASSCPVHHSLHPSIKQEMHFFWGPQA